jgi:hypothetical protein
LGDPAWSLRYEEEWAAHLQELPGRLSKLAAAVGFVLATFRLRRVLRTGWHSSRRWILVVALLGTGWWAVTYALELASPNLSARLLWGDLKYVGICLLAPAWFAFAVDLPRRHHWPTRLILALLAVEPILVLVMLANPATHDLVRFYTPAGGVVAEAGPLFWVHLTYTDLLMWVATAVFILSSARLSRLYRRQSLVVFASVLLPWVTNLLFNLNVGLFDQVDLTPFAFVFAVAVLTWWSFQIPVLESSPTPRVPRTRR